MKRKLGRGLSALIPEEMTSETIDQVVKNQGTLRELSLDEIMPKEGQPRSVFDDEALNELKLSIEQHGVLQPILVREASGKYEIIAGERRYRAAKLAELEKIPAIVLDVDDATSAQLSLIENIQREDLNPVEEALAYQKILRELSWTQAELANRLGKSRTYITNSLRLLKLEENYLAALISGDITSSQARTLLSMEEKQREKYFQKLLKKETNVREMERATKKPEADIYKIDQENRLCEYFGTKVKIVPKKKGGTIQLEYYNADDLERIIQILMA